METFFSLYLSFFLYLQISAVVFTPLQVSLVLFFPAVCTITVPLQFVAVVHLVAIRLTLFNILCQFSITTTLNKTISVVTIAALNDLQSVHSTRTNLKSTELNKCCCSIFVSWRNIRDT